MPICEYRDIFVTNVLVCSVVVLHFHHIIQVSLICATERSLVTSLTVAFRSQKVCKAWMISQRYVVIDVHVVCFGYAMETGCRVHSGYILLTIVRLLSLCRT